MISSSFAIRLVVIAALVYTSLPAIAATITDTLPRRGFFGARLMPVPNDARADLPVGVRGGVYIESVFPDSSAAASGFQARDILLQLDDVELKGRAAVPTAVSTIGGHRAGDSLEVAFFRNGQTANQILTLRPMPMGSDPAYDTHYDAVEVQGNLHRIILTKPKGDGPFPAVFYLQGIGCSSIEKPFQPDDVIRQFIGGLNGEGLATVRVEKRGLGDSEGDPCEELDFETELQGYLAAAEWALSRSEISHVFLFGHSMGGVFAPIVAQRHPVSGIIAFGTIAETMENYFKENNLRQMKLRERSEKHIEGVMKQIDLFVMEFFVHEKMPEEITTDYPELKPFFAMRNADDTHFHGRHAAFWHQLNRRDMPQEWRATDQPALIIWGQSEVPASRGDHILIARTINDTTPGRATQIEIPEMGHSFDTATTPRESLINRQSGPFNPAVVEVTAEWIRENLRNRQVNRGRI